MKRIPSLLLVLCLCLSMLAGCAATEAAPSAAETTAATTEATEPYVELTGKEALQGKRIMFIGNSYLFCGYTVLQGDCNVLLQDDRENDQGIFYQLCKANGIDVSVTSWAFGSHSMCDFFDGYCGAGRECDGVDHEIHITNPYFDYVVLQFHSERNYRGDVLDYLSNEMEFFRKANPNVKFIMHVPHMAYHKSTPAWLNDIDDLAEASVLIADWGQLCHDVVQGKAEVPGATQEYDLSTFVISWSETDGFHQNMLCGYLNALMVYCAITGESAVGQPWEFTNDSSLHPKMDWERAKALHYSYDPTTNFIEVFQSEADMHGLQQLADQYLAMRNK